MTISETALTVAHSSVETLPQAVMTLEEYGQRLALFQRFVNSQLNSGVDFGKIGSAEKPTLLQPGAQKIAEMYGLAITPRITARIEDWDAGFFYYEATCSLILKSSGVTVATAIGSCNSKEDRYAWRWVYERDIPKNLDKATLRSKEFKGKAGGHFFKWRIPNEDPYSLVNTFQKMAIKRAVVSVVLMATRSSGLFNVDLEDLPTDYIDGEAHVVEEPSPPKPAPKPAAKAPAPKQAPKPQTAAVADTRGPQQIEEYRKAGKCWDCHQQIGAYLDSNGDNWQPDALIAKSLEYYTVPLCGDDMSKRVQAGRASKSKPGSDQVTEQQANADAARLL